MAGIGRVTKAAGCALGLAFATMAAQAQADCKIEQVAELPVTVTHQRILTTVQLDGNPVQMMVDSGAFSTLLGRDLAEKLALPMHSSVSGLRVSGIGGEAQTMVANVAEMKFGPFKLKNDGILVAGRGDGGLVGRDMFGDYDVEFDLAHGVIRLLHPIGCKDEDMVYWGGKSYSEAPLEDRRSELGDYRTEIMLNGRAYPAILDTGAPRTTVTVGAAQLSGVTLASPGSIAAGDAGGVGPRRIPSFSGLFKSVGLGDEVIHDTRLFVADLWVYNTVEKTGTRFGAINDDPSYGLVGLDFFKSHRVLISPSHHKVFFSYLGGPIFLPPEPNTAPAPAAARVAPAAAPPQSAAPASAAPPHAP